MIICVLNLFYLNIPKDLKIYFVDVGQGDCSLIVTPNNKTILIDGEGVASFQNLILMLEKVCLCHIC